MVLLEVNKRTSVEPAEKNLLLALIEDLCFASYGISTFGKNKPWLNLPLALTGASSGYRNYLIGQTFQRRVMLLKKLWP